MPIVSTNQKQFNPHNERIKFEYKKHLARITLSLPSYFPAHNCQMGRNTDICCF